MDYKLFLDMGDPEAQGDRAFENYLEKMRKMQEEMEARNRTSMVCNAYGGKEGRYDADVNFSIKNRMMDMRKTCNHPYLIEYPMTGTVSTYL